jgi:hypothetical protein
MDLTQSARSCELGRRLKSFMTGHMIEQARLLTLKAAWMMDSVGNEVHRNQIAKMEIGRHHGTDPAKTGGDAAVLTAEQAEQLATQGLWPKPPGWCAE